MKRFRDYLVYGLIVGLILSAASMLYLRQVVHYHGQDLDKTTKLLLFPSFIVIEQELAYVLGLVYIELNLPPQILYIFMFELLGLPILTYLLSMLIGAITWMTLFGIIGVLRTGGGRR